MMHHSPPPRAEVKNEWRYTSTPSYAFMARREQLFTLLLYIVLNHKKIFKEISMQSNYRQYLKV